ncbi:MAG: Cache 3/Cache 2 fusion domain-containing protein, partial [Deltaproteobacteria bacterium]|nr:Cache 3/Cache 2 fusion domain-containing protein [Deltaproteobacteria bacterium]
MNITGYMKNRGIQRKLVVSFVLMGIIPMIIMGSVFYYKSSDILLKNANSEMTNLTAKTIEQVDTELRLLKMQFNNLVLPAQQVVDMIGVGIDIDVGTRENMVKFYDEYMKANPIFKRVRFFNAKGDEKLSSKKEASDQSQSTASLSWFQKAMTSKEPIFSEIHMSKEIGEPIVVMAKAFYGTDGKPFALAAADLSAELVTKPLTSIKIGKAGYAYIINKEGIVVAYPDRTKNFQLDMNKYDFGKEMLQKKQGVIEYDWEGGRRLASFQAYPAMEWIIVTATQKGEVLSSINTMQIIFIILLVVMAVLSLIAGVVFTVRLVKPINRVVDGLLESADQVASASDEVSVSSQHLA